MSCGWRQTLKGWFMALENKYDLSYGTGPFQNIPIWILGLYRHYVVHDFIGTTGLISFFFPMLFCYITKSWMPKKIAPAVNGLEKNWPKFRRKAYFRQFFSSSYIGQDKADCTYHSFIDGNSFGEVLDSFNKSFRDEKNNSTKNFKANDFNSFKLIQKCILCILNSSTKTQFDEFLVVRCCISFNLHFPQLKILIIKSQNIAFVLKCCLRPYIYAMLKLSKTTSP